MFIEEYIVERSRILCLCLMDLSLFEMQIGSIFEYVNQNPVFGVLNSDSIFYAPLLGFFAITGIPTSVCFAHLENMLIV